MVQRQAELASIQERLEDLDEEQQEQDKRRAGSGGGGASEWTVEARRQRGKGES